MVQENGDMVESRKGLAKTKIMPISSYHSSQLQTSPSSLGDEYPDVLTLKSSLSRATVSLSRTSLVDMCLNLEGTPTVGYQWNRPLLLAALWMYSRNSKHPGLRELCGYVLLKRNLLKN